MPCVQLRAGIFIVLLALASIQIIIHNVVITCLGNVIVALKCFSGNVQVYAWFACAAARMALPSELKVALSLGSACICFAWCMEWSECGMVRRKIGYSNCFDSMHLILFNSS